MNRTQLRGLLWVYESQKRSSYSVAKPHRNTIRWLLNARMIRRVPLRYERYEPTETGVTILRLMSTLANLHPEVRSKTIAIFEGVRI